MIFAVRNVTKYSTNNFLSMFRVSFHSEPPPVEWGEGIFSHKVKVGPHRLHYLRAGRGPHVVVLLPGVLGDGWCNFREQLLGFDRDLFTTIALDPPGTGFSRPPELTFRPYEQQADTVADFMDALGVECASVLGYSGGGRTAMALAALHQRRVRRLVLVSTHALLLPDEHYASKLLENVEETWPEEYKKWMYGIYGKENLAKVWRQFIDFDANFLKEQCGNICLHLLKDIKCPTQLIFGQKDPLTKIENGWLLHALIKNSRMHVYPEGRHSVVDKYTEDFNKRVQDFLKDESISDD